MMVNTCLSNLDSIRMSWSRKSCVAGRGSHAVKLRRAVSVKVNKKEQLVKNFILCYRSFHNVL